jgi:hypothetical protein
MPGTGHDGLLGVMGAVRQFANTGPSRGRVMLKEEAEFAGLLRGIDAEFDPVVLRIGPPQCAHNHR